MSEVETLIKEMRDMTEVLKESRGDKATVDFEELKENFSEAMNELVEEQVKANLAAAPSRPVPGDAVGLDGEEPITKSNRYHRHVKSFRKDGHLVDGYTKIRPVDLMLAQLMLDGQHQAQKAAGRPVGVNVEDALPASDDLRAAVKALTSTGSGTGDELVPTGMAAQLWQDIFLASIIVTNMIETPMPTNPFDIPLGLGDVTWRKGTENTATTASDPATAKSVLTVTELVTEQNWSYTLDEDAVIAMAPAIRQRLAISGAEIIDSFALNADNTNAGTGNINLDDADPDDDSYYLSAGQNGLRHQWIVDKATQGVDAGGDALTAADILAMLGKMGKYAVNPAEVRLVTDVSTYLAGFLDLDEVRTIDKFGPNAVVVTGQLAAFQGLPIIVSTSAPLTEADGKVSTTSGNNTLGQITAFNRMMWYAGFIRDLMIEVDRDIQKRMYIMVTSLRQAVGAHGTRASATHTAGIRNILV